MAGILKNLECCSITVGGYVGHIHILCNLSKKYATIKVLQIVKKESSKWVKDNESGIQSFHWQDGYGLFSVGTSHLETVCQYILKQDEHYQKIPFQKELLGILRKNNKVRVITNVTFGIEEQVVLPLKGRGKSWVWDLTP